MKGSVQWEEVVWMVFAIPGLYLWTRNLMSARKTLGAVRLQHVGNGRMTWASFSAFLTATFVGIELVFIAVGFVSLFRRPSDDANTLTQLIVVIGLVGSSATITVLARRWQQVDNALIDSARRRSAEREELVSRGETQDIRGTEQDKRGEEQDARGGELSVRETTQDARTTAQDVRGAAQDERTVSQDARDNRDDEATE